MHPSSNVTTLLEVCEKANSFQELVVIAGRELKKFASGCEFVCGPISTGGRGTAPANLAVFQATIAALQKEGRPIFSQLPYEARIFFFRERWRAEDPMRANQYFMPILTDFYLPLFQTGCVTKGWFIPGWQSSFGARWEREQLEWCGAEIVDLPHSWIESLRIAA